MASPSDNQPSKELLELILFALQHGIDSVREGGPLVPFLLSTGSGRPTLQRFVGESLDASRQMLLDAASKLPPEVERYAFAVDGYLVDGEMPSGGARRDAIVVEAGERGSTGGFTFAQAYQARAGAQQLAKLGQPVWIGEAVNRLA